MTFRREQLELEQTQSQTCTVFGSNLIQVQLFCLQPRLYKRSKFQYEQYIYIVFNVFFFLSKKCLRRFICLSKKLWNDTRQTMAEVTGQPVF